MMCPRHIGYQSFRQPSGTCNFCWTMWYCKQIKENLTDDLLKKGKGGHCYVASEAFYHLMGGKEAGYKPITVKHEGTQHWWVGRVFESDPSFNFPGGIEHIDLTADQFKTPVPYDKGKGCGFLTKQPSKRAQILIDRIKK